MHLDKLCVQHRAQSRELEHTPQSMNAPPTVGVLCNICVGCQHLPPILFMKDSLLFIVQSAVIISPSNLMSTSQTQTTTTISWDHIPNSVISYEVSYTYQGPCSGVDDSGTETVAGPLTQHTLMGLEEFSTHMITVRAVYNGIYSGSITVSVTTLSSGM